MAQCEIVRTAAETKAEAKAKDGAGSAKKICSCLGCCAPEEGQGTCYVPITYYSDEDNEENAGSDVRKYSDLRNTLDKATAGIDHQQLE